MYGLISSWIDGVETSPNDISKDGNPRRSSRNKGEETPPKGKGKDSPKKEVNTKVENFEPPKLKSETMSSPLKEANKKRGKPGFFCFFLYCPF
jgi:hypothetical protein